MPADHEQWARLAPCLPRSTGKAARPFTDHRRIIEGITVACRWAPVDRQVDRDRPVDPVDRVRLAVTWASNVSQVPSAAHLREPGAGGGAELETRFGIANMTARSAIAVLRSEGLVHTSPGPRHVRPVSEPFPAAFSVSRRRPTSAPLSLPWHGRSNTSPDLESELRCATSPPSAL
jgi:hypothetical protein